VADVLSLVTKYCPNAMTLIKDPSKVVSTLTKIGPSIQTALRLDPKSVQGTSNTIITKAAAVAARSQDTAAKAIKTATQDVQERALKVAKDKADAIKKQALNAASTSLAKNAAPLMQQYSVAMGSVNSLKQSASAIVEATSSVFTAQKLLKQINFKQANASRVKVPSGETTSIQGKITAIKDLAESQKATLDKLKLLKKDADVASEALKSAKEALEKAQKSSALINKQ